MIARFNPGQWSSEEDALLVSLYPTKGMDACLAAIPNRSNGAIQTRAKKLGVKLSPEMIMKIRKEAAYKGTAVITRWDEEFDARLREVYTRYGTLAACRALPQFNKKAIKNRAYHLGLKVMRGQFGELTDIPEDWEEQMPVKRVVPVGAWVADVPPIRSVFDLAEAV